MRFHDAAGGDGWTYRAGWGEGEPCRDAWYGVYCCPSMHPRLKLALAIDGTHTPAMDQCWDDEEGMQGTSPSRLRGEANVNTCGTEDACVVVAL